MTLFANPVELPLDAITGIEYCEQGMLLTLDAEKAHDIARQFGRYTKKLKLSILIWDGLYNDEPCLMSLIVTGQKRVWGDGVYDLIPSDSERRTTQLMREYLSSSKINRRGGSNVYHRYQKIRSARHVSA